MAELNINSKYVLLTGHEIPLLGYGVYPLFSFFFSHCICTYLRPIFLSLVGPTTEMLCLALFSDVIFFLAMLIDLSNRCIKREMCDR